MGVWDRYVVPPLIACACKSEPILKQREKIVPQASGTVLEVGCGSGTNFGYYDIAKVDKLIAIEPAEGMISRAKKAIVDTDMAEKTEFFTLGAEALPMEDNSVDTTVLTFVLCTIPGWTAALSEIRRVTRPGGLVLWSEHGKAPDDGVAKWQRRIEPVWKAVLGGCHLTRDPVNMLSQSGFNIVREDKMYLPSTPKFAGYCSWGAAKPA